MSKHWRWVAPLAYPLLALNALIALLYAFLWCHAHSWQWRNGVFTFIAGTKPAPDGGGRVSRMVGNPGGQGWSWIVGYASEEQRQRDDLRGHENCHVVQEMVCALAGFVVGVAGAVALNWSHEIEWTIAGSLGGALFALLYGALFLGYYLTKQKDEKPGWEDDYRRNPFERQAYARQAAFLVMTPEQRKAVWT